MKWSYRIVNRWERVKWKDKGKQFVWYKERNERKANRKLNEKEINLSFVCNVYFSIIDLSLNDLSVGY